MITGLGTDIVEIARVEKAVSDSFMKKVLSIEEYERALTMSEGRRIQFLAGRFAAKEAIIKCLSDHEVPEMCNLNIINKNKTNRIICSHNSIRSISSTMKKANRRFDTRTIAS